MSLSSEVSGEILCIFFVSIDEGIRWGEFFIFIYWFGVWGFYSKFVKFYVLVIDVIFG